jgi:Calx-beta domain/Galactose oxidase-like, Early set domain/Glyoxal oxidase N-terminus
MPHASRTTRNLIKVAFVLIVMLFALNLFVPGQSISIKTAAASNAHEPPASSQLAVQPAVLANGTSQDFDTPGTGTPYVLGVHHADPTTPPAVLDGGPTGYGKLMRLAYGDPPLTHNSIAFDRSDVGAFDQITADFDFRIQPASGRADGIGFALLNTAYYGTTGAVGPQAAPYDAEEPNYLGSLGIGFDVYRSPGPPLELNDNHVSVHFNGVLLREFDARPALDMAGGQWVHARIIMWPGGGFSEVSVILIQCGRPPVTVVDHLRVPGFTPYEGRAHLAARSGGLTADQDIDNVRVQFLTMTQSALAFRTGCASVVETDGTRLISVDRVGSSNGTVTVNYATSNGTATAGADYTATAGTLTFQNGEIAKTFSVPIRNDAADEGDEDFLVSLSNPTGGGAVGGPAIMKVTIIDDEAARRVGHWSEVIPSQVIAIHMQLLPTGKLMYWDRHDMVNAWDGDPRIWDPTTEAITKAAQVAYDIFCGGHSFLEDGTLLVTGGHIDNRIGEDKASIYNPYTNTWTRLPNMNAGRWYPSNVTLANGDVLVMAGTNAHGIDTLPQVWDTAKHAWRNLTTALQGQFPDYSIYYPFLYVAPNGKIFNAGPQQMARYLDTTGTGAWTDVASSTLTYREYGSSVMYADGKVMIVGGNPPDEDPNMPPTNIPSASTEVIDLNAAHPAWRSVAPLHTGRRHLNTTLLPDGKVLATGGSSLPGFDNQAGAVFSAELWDPMTEQWTVMASETRYRGYHSTAVLLPDGRVLEGGGGHPDASGGAQYNFEIYSPPYLFKGPRPTITDAPTLVSYGHPFTVQTPDAANIVSARWIRLSAVTHAFNQNQRLNVLPITHQLGALSLAPPNNPNLAPPGDYMLFLVNSNGVPSVARIIRLVDKGVYLPFIRR